MVGAKRINRYKKELTYQHDCKDFTICNYKKELVESTAPEIVGDDDVSDGVEHELDVVGVGSTGGVAVDVFGGALVLGLELRLDVVRGRVELLGTWGHKYFNFIFNFNFLILIFYFILTFLF